MVAVVALVAGADTPAAVRLGVAMTALQVSIGALNDLVDAPRDAGRVPPKPIPAGLVSPAVARVVALLGAVVGLLFAAPSGLPTLLVAGLVLAIGYGYDLVFKGTAWSWLPFAVGIPVLPVFAWLGATGGIPDSFAILLPTAVVAGAALAIGNARADLERDELAGVDSVAFRLGLDRAWTISAALLTVVVLMALVTLGHDSAPLPLVGAVSAGLIIGLGVVIARRGDATRRERAWELEAIGVGLLAAAWFASGPKGG